MGKQGKMNHQERKNTVIAVSSSCISRFGGMVFDFANNTFLVGLNASNGNLVAIYQSTEVFIGIVMNIFGGVFADRFKRQKILIITDLLSGVACLLLAVFTNQKALLYGVIIVNIILAILSSFGDPAYRAITKELVRKEYIGRLNSIASTCTQVVKVITPMIAAGIVGVVGVRGALVLDGVSFFLSAGILFFLCAASSDTAMKKSANGFKEVVQHFFADVKEGFVYLVKEREVFLLIVMSSVINSIFAAYTLLLPFANVMFPEVHGNVYAGFLAASSVGGICGAMMSTRLNRKENSLKMIFMLGLSGICIMGITGVSYLTNELLILCIPIAVFDFFLAAFNLQFFTIVQSRIEDAYLGRVFSIIFTVAILLMPVGSLFFSWVMDIREVFNFVWIGFSVIVIAIVFAFLLKRMRGKQLS